MAEPNYHTEVEPLRGSLFVQRAKNRAQQQRFEAIADAFGRLECLSVRAIVSPMSVDRAYLQLLAEEFVDAIMSRTGR